MDFFTKIKPLTHFVESVRISSYSGPYFLAFGLNTDQHNYEYGHFLRGNSRWNSPCRVRRLIHQEVPTRVCQREELN